VRRLNCTVSDKRGVNGDCMEFHAKGKYLRYTEANAQVEALVWKCDKQEKRIAELEKENASLNDQNKRVCTEFAELEKNISMLEQYNGSVESLIKDIEAYNLKQHSLAVNNFANKFCGDATTNYQVQLTIDAHCWCEMLDSKALKEGKKDEGFHFNDQDFQPEALKEPGL
jgi:hypothetical protein